MQEGRGVFDGTLNQLHIYKGVRRLARRIIRFPRTVYPVNPHPLVRCISCSISPILFIPPNGTFLWQEHEGEVRLVRVARNLYLAWIVLGPLYDGPIHISKCYAVSHFLLGLTAPIVERLREWSKKLRSHERWPLGMETSGRIHCVST